MEIFHVYMKVVRKKNPTKKSPMNTLSRFTCCQHSIKGECIEVGTVAQRVKPLLGTLTSNIKHQFNSWLLYS